MDIVDFKNEFKFILLRSFLLDISFYLISVFIIGFSFSMAFGLMIGTLGLSLNLFLLYKSIKKIVNYSNSQNSSSKMFRGYLFRLFVSGIIITISMKIDYINVVGAVIPYFYPKLIYFGNNIIKRRDKY